MPEPIVIDLNGLKDQFGLSADTIDFLTEQCVNAVSAGIYGNWEAIAKQRLKSSLPDYLTDLNYVDKGRLAKQIILTGVLPNMIEQGASAFDMKTYFQRSGNVKLTKPVYNKKGELIYQGGDWYLTIPFRIGTPGTLGQAGFTGELPQEVYDVAKTRKTGQQVKLSEIPSPYDERRIRPDINDPKTGGLLYGAYQHKNSIYEGLAKRTGVYAKTVQNTYNTFRRAGKNSDPLSWIHKGIQAYNIAEAAVRETDVDTIVENEVIEYLNTVL